MKVLILLAAILPGSFAYAAADTEAQQLLSAAERQSNLLHNAKAPLTLSVDFTAQINVPTKGNMTMRWESEDRWWRKIVLGDYEQITVHNGEKVSTIRNLAYTPLRVRELVTLIQFAEDPDRLIAKKQKQRRDNGVELTCIRYEKQHSENEPHDVCISPSSHDIVSDDWQEPPDEKRHKQFSDYVDFEGLRFPQQLRLQVNGSVVLSAKVTNLKSESFDERLLTVPKGAMVRRECHNLQQPVPLKTPEPKVTGLGTLMGDTTVALTVLEDGSVGDVQLIGSAFRKMDEETLKALKGWRFKPAMCGDDPVISDIEVVVSLRRQ